MQAVHLRKYGVEATIDFELYEVDGVDLRVDWVPAAADCEVMKDGGASTQCTNTATDEGSTYSIVLTTTEMEAARLVIKIVDAATKAFLDKVIMIETYGHASAQHAMDLDDSVRGGMTALPNAAAEAAGGLYTRGSGAGQINQNANGQIDSNPVAISGDTTAANNLELQYDTTGLTGDTFPATQSQVGNIATGAGGLSALISAFAKVGTEPETNTFTATQEGDLVYHIVEDDAPNTDFYYQATVGAGGKATSFNWKGYVQSNGDSASVWYWDWVSTTYKQIDTLSGSNGTTPSDEVFKVPVGATGTGADEGKVRLRFLSTTTTAIATDRLLCEFTQASQSVGYANGRIWVDSNSSNTNTVSFVDGVADNVAGSWANAVTLSGQIGLTDFHVINGSTIALTGTSDNFSLFGDNWILQLASRSVAGAYFQGAHVSGIGTSATEVHFEGCDVATMSVQIGHFDFCSFSGTVTHTLVGDYNYHNCYSKVPGPLGPTFAKTAGQTITAQWRGWKGSLNLTGLEVGDTLTIGGEEIGTIDLGSPAGAVVVEIRGIYKALVNVGSASVNLDGAILAADVALILADTNELQIDWTDGGRLDLILDIIAADTTTDIPALIAALVVPDPAGTAPTAAEVVNEWETQSQADPTGFHVNVKELDGSAIQQASGYIKVSDGTGTGQINTTNGFVNTNPQQDYSGLYAGGSFGKILQNIATTTEVFVAAADVTVASDGLDAVLVDGKTLPAALQIIAAGVIGKISGAGTGTEIFVGLDGATTRATVTVDGSGNRTEVVYVG